MTAANGGATSARLLRSHPLRDLLTNEVHARPVTGLVPPERISHLAFLSAEASEAQVYEHLVLLCQSYGVAPPSPDLNHFSYDFGTFRLKWERHTEFATYTFFRDGPFDDPFAEPAIGGVTHEWLVAVPGALLVAVHVAILPHDAAPPGTHELVRIFAPDSIVGCQVAGGAGSAYTDYRIHADGFGRVLIHDHGLGNRQAGRLVQRLLEIETYRMMALLALPLAREAAPEIARVERELAEAMATMAVSDSAVEERALLDQLIRLAASIERLSATRSYRFAAARAYGMLVDRRIRELREERIVGLQTIAEFMDRRLRPALQTCEAVAQGQQSLSQRIARASQLLRTRVDIVLEGQNRDLLHSMDQRAKVQLLLQETVEGLSVVAITYYLLGLLSYAGKAAKALHLPVDAELAPGLALPFALASVWWGLRLLKLRALRRER